MTRPLTPLVVVLLTACGRAGYDAAQAPEPSSMELEDEAMRGGGAAPPGAPMPAAKMAEEAAPDRFVDVLPEEGAEEEPADDAKDAAPGGEGAPATRAWFPETFLFEPVVVTDAEGRARVPVTVPDRLTTWRVLALAHDRQGHQAGDLTSFLGTLPVYVDPVVPPTLVAGDRVALPVQVVNTSEAAWQGPVAVAVSGAAEAAWQAQVAVGPGDSAVLYAPLHAPRAGSLSVEVKLGATDAVRRAVEVLPAGRKLEQSRSGTLAAPRSFTIVGERDMDPHSARVRVAVSPGALALLRRELARAAAAEGSGDLATDAYGLLLTGSAPALLQALGEPLDEDGAAALRDASLRASQRVMRHALAPSTDDAALLLPAAAAHPDNPVLGRLAERLAGQLAAAQRPDGTFMGGAGWTVQRVLAATAEATAAVGTATTTPAGQQRAARVRLAAGAAFERNLGHVQDPYTAAALLVSGAMTEGGAAPLRALVRAAVQQRPDGSRVLPPPAGAVRPDGRPPSEAECTALAALALHGDAADAALVADLAAGVLGAWSPTRGWGDGRADLWGTRAVTTLLRAPLPEEIVVVVERDGQEQARGALTGARRTELLLLEVPGDRAAGSHEWTVRAEPAVPGLGFTFALQSWVPWPPPAADQGVEVQVQPPDGLQVGRPGTLTLAIAAPRNQALEVEQPLPAGVQADADALSGLVAAGLLTAYEVEDGLLRLSTAPQDATAFTLELPVVATLAGTVHAGATLATPLGRPDLVYAVPGAAWTVR